MISIAQTPATGGNVRIGFGGLIPTNAATLTAMPDGSAIVGNDSGSFQANVRIAADGVLNVVHDGGLYPMRDFAVASDGSGFAGGSDAFYSIDVDGGIERHTAPGGRNRVAVAGGHVFALNASANTAFYEIEPVLTDIAPGLAQMRQAMQDAARLFETYPNYGTPAEAFRLILLAETRPYLGDAALIQRVDTRIAALVQALRNSIGKADRPINPTLQAHARLNAHGEARRFQVFLSDTAQRRFSGVRLPWISVCAFASPSLRCPLSSCAP